jgi:signal transduction histidine kinase/DNA-binding NarL/FixJ family response regulator
MSKWESLLPQTVHRSWRELSITGKFTLAFGAFLALIVLVALTSYIALTTARRQMEAAIVTSMEIQRLVLQMDAGLQRARLLERNFFLRSPTIGFSRARETYARQNDEKIAEVVALSTRLQQLISEPDVSDALRESKVNLNFYLSAADRYAAAFDEAVELEARLAADETGAQARLAQTSELLGNTLQGGGDPALMLLYREMQSFEKDYLLTRQGSYMQSAFNVAILLGEAISRSPTLEANQQAQALAHLNDHESVAKEVLKLDVEIRSKLNEFDLQAESIDPISEELIALANAEVQRTRDRIASANQLATVLLIATILAAVVLASVVATVFNNSITRNVIKLTEVAGQLRDGNLEVRAQINSADELGQLADSFNAMATRINALVNDLEQQIAERTATNKNLQREIAERKRIEEELRKYQEGLEELVKERTSELARATSEAEEARVAAENANRAKSVFLANMSHELRTPLNAILGFSQIMQRDPTLTTKQQENLNLINRSGEHLLTLINDVLEMSKIEAGRVTLNEDICDLYHLLDDLENMLRLRAMDKGLHLHFERALDVPQYVRTDEGKLRQVLINLLSNAIRFTTEGYIKCQVSMIKDQTKNVPPGPETPDTFKLWFEVSDTGLGIALDELDTIFDAFVQTESGRLSQRGTGLGLPISRQFVQLLGGEMGVKSEIGQGTTFQFDIQTSSVEAVEVPTTQPTHQVVGLAPNQPVYRLLVVDDNIDNRKLLVNLLESLGFDVREAGNGQEGIEIWEQWQPDLIWMDIRMPVLDGYEATRRIKATPNGQSTIIVALTAGAFEEERAAVLSIGCDDFVRKPFQEAEIYNKIAEHLGVRYVYEEARARSQEPGSGGQLSIEDLESELATLPAELLANFKEAVELGNVRKVDKAIAEIHGHNAPLAKTLANLADNFEYDKLLTLAQRTNDLI